MNHHSKRYITLFLKLLVSAGFIAFLAYKLDTPDIRNGFINMDVKVFLESLLVIMSLIALQGCRWLVIARTLGIAISFRSAISLSFISSFFSQVMPSAVGGDAVRVYLLYRAGTALGLSINSTIIDRVLAVFGLVLLATFGFWIVGWENMPIKMNVILAIFAVFVVFGIAVLLCLDRIPLPSIVLNLRLVQRINHISSDARHICQSPSAVLVGIVASLITHIGVSTVFWQLGLKVGLGAEVSTCIAIVPLATLATIIPISVGGWGVREGVLVLAFSSLGGNSSAAFITSILFGLATTCASLPGALFLLKFRDSKMPKT